MRKQRAESPVRFAGLTPDPHIGEDTTHPQGVDLTVMQYINPTRQTSTTVASAEAWKASTICARLCQWFDTTRARDTR